MENDGEMVIGVEYVGGIDKVERFEVVYRNELIDEVYVEQFVEVWGLFFWIVWWVIYLMQGSYVEKGDTFEVDAFDEVEGIIDELVYIAI